MKKSKLNKIGLQLIPSRHKNSKTRYWQANCVGTFLGFTNSTHIDVLWQCSYEGHHWESIGRMLPIDIELYE